jgi:hypothetical protein
MSAVTVPAEAARTAAPAACNDITGAALAALADPATARIDAAATAYEGWLRLLEPEPWTETGEFARTQIRAAAGDLAAALAERSTRAAVDVDLMAALWDVADGRRAPAPFATLISGGYTSDGAL